jgi:hypothetical protein
MIYNEDIKNSFLLSIKRLPKISILKREYIKKIIRSYHVTMMSTCNSYYNYKNNLINLLYDKFSRLLQFTIHWNMVDIIILTEEYTYEYYHMDIFVPPNEIHLFHDKYIYKDIHHTIRPDYMFDHKFYSVDDLLNFDEIEKFGGLKQLLTFQKSKNCWWRRMMNSTQFQPNIILENFTIDNLMNFLKLKEVNQITDNKLFQFSIIEYNNGYISIVN